MFATFHMCKPLNRNAAPPRLPAPPQRYRPASAAAAASLKRRPPTASRVNKQQNKSRVPIEVPVVQDYRRSSSASSRRVSQQQHCDVEKVEVDENKIEEEEEEEEKHEEASSAPLDVQPTTTTSTSTARPTTATSTAHRRKHTIETGEGVLRAMGRRDAASTASTGSAAPGAEPEHSTQYLLAHFKGPSDDDMTAMQRMSPLELQRRRNQLRRSNPHALRIEAEAHMHALDVQEEYRLKQQRHREWKGVMLEQLAALSKRKEDRRRQQELERQEHAAYEEETQTLLRQQNEDERRHRVEMAKMRDASFHNQLHKEREERQRKLEEKRQLDASVAADAVYLKGLHRAQRERRAHAMQDAVVDHQRALKERESRRRDDAELAQRHLHHYTQFADEQERKRRDYFERIHKKQQQRFSVASAAADRERYEASLEERQRRQAELADIAEELKVEQSVRNSEERRTRYRRDVESQIEETRHRKQRQKERQLAYENKIVEVDQLQAQMFRELATQEQEEKRRGVQERLGQQIHDNFKHDMLRCVRED